MGPLSTSKFYAGFESIIYFGIYRLVTEIYQEINHGYSVIRHTPYFFFRDWQMGPLSTSKFYAGFESIIYFGIYRLVTEIYQEINHGYSVIRHTPYFVFRDFSAANWHRKIDCTQYYPKFYADSESDVYFEKYRLVTELPPEYGKCDNIRISREKKMFFIEFLSWF